MTVTPFISMVHWTIEQESGGVGGDVLTRLANPCISPMSQLPQKPQHHIVRSCWYLLFNCLLIPILCLVSHEVLFSNLKNP